MPPKITSVKWRCNGWLPEGILFDENTGTFTGTPSADDVGEFVLPITVKTNYGQDTKDVMIIVEPPPCGVYAIGTKAQDWTSGTKDTEGFYPLNIPRMHELYSWPNGFRAYKSDGTIYGCGLTGINHLQTNGQWKKGYYYDPNFWVCDINPVKIESNAAHYGVSCDFAFGWSSSTGTASSGASETFSGYLIFVSDKTGEIATQIKAYQRLTYSSGQIQSQMTLSPSLGSSKAGFIVPSSSKLSSGKRDILQLSQDKKAQIKYSLTLTKGGRVSWTTETQALGFTAKKIIPTGPVTFLPEDTSLAAELLEFPSEYGTIEDAWYNDNKLVQTTDKKLYSYSTNTNDWELLGEYSIKKVEQGFFLMDDGSLYHKGASVSGITGGHATLTRIFPTLNFVDFVVVTTFPQTSAGNFSSTPDGTTLVVLRE